MTKASGGNSNIYKFESILTKNVEKLTKPQQDLVTRSIKLARDTNMFGGQVYDVMQSDKSSFAMLTAPQKKKLNTLTDVNSGTNTKAIAFLAKLTDKSLQDYLDALTVLLSKLPTSSQMSKTRLRKAITFFKKLRISMQKLVDKATKMVG